LLLPPILRFNYLANGDQYQRLALAVDWTIRLEAAKERDVAWQVIEEVETLLKDIGLPKRLSEMNVWLDNKEALIEEAYTSFLNQVNPRLASRKQVEDILAEII
jgi:alcohol dehydrogenase class IV